MKQKQQNKKDSTTRMRHKKITNLTEKYKLFSYLMDHVPDVIYFKDRMGKLILVNKAHADGLGLKPEEVVGKTDFDLFPKKRAQAMTSDDRRVLRTGRAIYDKIERATRPDGVDNYVTTTKIPMRNEKGVVVGLIGITRDITRRMQFEQLRRQKTRMENKLEALKQLNVLKSEFVSAVSHELRTPLAIIQQLITLLSLESTGYLNNKQEEVVIRVARNIDRLKKLVDELLDLSRIERKSFQLHYSLVNLNVLIKESSQFFETLAREKNIRIQYSLPKEEVNLFVDVDRIHQVLSNLINNAINFSESGSTITMEMKNLLSKVRIGCSDTGIGIPKSDIPKIFDKFVQTSKQGETIRKGIGLGLSIARDLVERHGGEMWVESRLGVGSKFYFTLPRLYTSGLFDKDLQRTINTYLRKGISVQFINLVIVDYEGFKEQVKIKPAHVFDDLEAIIIDACKTTSHSPSRFSPKILKNIRQGKCNIILPGVGEKRVGKISSLLKQRFKEYFIEKKINGAFLVLGVLSYSKAALRKAGKKELPALCNIKQELYIGSEMRRFKRFPYRANCLLYGPGKKSKAARTIDISEGGICVVTEWLLKTDSQFRIRLALSKRKKHISLRVRVAWIREAEHVKGEVKKRYKVGLEFTSMQKAQRKLLMQELHQLSRDELHQSIQKSVVGY